MDLQRLLELYKYDSSVIYDLVRAFLRENDFKNALSYALKEDLRIAHKIIKEYIDANHSVQWVIDGADATDDNGYPYLQEHVNHEKASVPDLSSNSILFAKGKEAPFRNLNIAKYNRGVIIHDVYVPVFWTKDFARLYACDAVELFLRDFEINNPEVSFPRMYLEQARLYVENKECVFPLFLDYPANISEGHSFVCKAAESTHNGPGFLALKRCFKEIGYIYAFDKKSDDETKERMQKILISYYLGDKIVDKKEIPCLLS